MELRISSFADAGDLARERIVIRANESVDIGAYVILRSQRNDEDSPTSGTKSAYWLPDITIDAGDSVVLYTKKGKSSKKKLESGHTAHFYYWGYEQAFWGKDKKNIAVLLKTETWAAKLPPVS